MSIEPWQIPILAMAVIAGPTSIFWAVRWFRSRSSALDAAPVNSSQEPNSEHARSDSVRNRTALEVRNRTATALEKRRALIFAVLTTILLVIFVIILGEEAANTLIAAATVVTALVSAVLTVHSAFVLQELQKERQKLHQSGQGQE